MVNLDGSVGSVQLVNARMVFIGGIVLGMTQGKRPTPMGCRHKTSSRAPVLDAMVGLRPGWPRCFVGNRCFASFRKHHSCRLLLRPTSRQQLRGSAHVSAGPSFDYGWRETRTRGPFPSEHMCRKVGQMTQYKKENRYARHDKRSGKKGEGTSTPRSQKNGQRRWRAIGRQ
jgi:hypothetical protein